MAAEDDDHIIKTEEQDSSVVIQEDPSSTETPNLATLSSTSPTSTDSPFPSTRTTASRKRPKSRQSWSSWFLGHVARLLLWYTILTIAFQCPSEPSELTKESPRVCRPYLTGKRYVLPYVQPYYNTYASPYVDKWNPYLASLNTRVVQPAVSIIAPQLAHAQTYLAVQNQKYLHPYFESAKDSLQSIYDENLSHRVQQISDTAAPYYETARENAIHAHRNHIMPAIAYSQPQLQNASTLVKKFVLETVYPLVKHAGTYVVIFIEGSVWPTIKRVYSNNVRPQLVMISERISIYQQGRKLQSVVEQVDSSLSSSLASASIIAQTSDEVSTSITTSLIMSSVSSLASSLSSTISSTTAPSSSQHELQTDEIVAADLSKWRKKFSVAAETAEEDLHDRIGDIVRSMVSIDMSEGQNLKSALIKTVEVELDSLRLKMQAITGSIDDTQRYAKGDQDNVNQAIRSYGQQIKKRAKAVRSWADTYSASLNERVNLAIDSTLHVLDDIRDLGLQDLGTRWAKLEGMTYKHWRDYHDLKRSFAGERSEIRKICMQHPALLDAQKEIKRVVEEAMATTEDAVNELVKMKEEVAGWHIDAGTAQLSKDVPIMGSVRNAAAAVTGEIEDLTSVLKETVTNVASSVYATFSSSSTDAPSSVSSLVDGTVPSFAESLTLQGSSLLSQASQSPSSSLSEASKSVSSDAYTKNPNLESIASVASSGIGSVESGASIVASDLSSGASAAIVESGPTSIESFASTVTSDVSSVASAVSDRASSSIQSFVGSIADTGSGEASSLASAASSLSSSAASVASDSGSSLISEASASASSIAPNAAASIKSKASSVKAAVSNASDQASSSFTAAVEDVEDVEEAEVADEDTTDAIKDQIWKQEL